jgi:cellulase/cellobiase CelA1
MGGQHRRYDDEGRLPRPSLSSWITGPGRYAAGTAAAVLAVSGAGVGFVVHQSSGGTPRADARTTLSSCGLVNCADLGTASSGAAPATTPVSSTHLGSATTTHRSPQSGLPAVVPAGVTPTDASSSSGAAPTTPANPPAPSPTLTTPTPSPVPAATTPTPTPSPTTPSPAAAASPDVTVTYSTSPHHRSGFFGHLTIENLGTAPVSGWQLVLTLPGDDVNWVWNAQWQLSGDTLTLTPADSGDVIAPGASVSVNFSANGDTTAPTSCTFNGAACTSS